MSTGICQYFSPTTPFPSRKDTRIRVATCEANRRVKRVLDKEARQQSAKKRKQYSNFLDTDRAEIGQYAAISVTTCLLVKIEGGTKISTADSQR